MIVLFSFSPAFVIPSRSEASSEALLLFLPHGSFPWQQGDESPCHNSGALAVILPAQNPCCRNPAAFAEEIYLYLLSSRLTLRLYIIPAARTKAVAIMPINV